MTDQSRAATAAAESTDASAQTSLALVLERIAGRAHGFDSQPRFPTPNFVDLSDAGLLEAPEGRYVAEVELVRAIAAADASTARIFDGHLNALERLRLAQRGAESEEWDATRAHGMVLGVWGADPRPGEGTPAKLEPTSSGWVINGVKTFCSGAGGVDRALVVVSASDGTRWLAYIDSTDSRMEIDRSWYGASGLRASESHRVRFHALPVLALLGGPDELAREPHLSRDAIRTAATWVGLVDAILEEVLVHVGEEPISELAAYRLGQMRLAAATIDRWFEHTVRLLADALELDDPPAAEQLAPTLEQSITTSIECRAVISQCARAVIELSAEVCGSRGLIGGSRLDRSRRDLDLFLLQHRLDHKIVGLGKDLAGGHGNE